MNSTKDGSTWQVICSRWRDKFISCSRNPKNGRTQHSGNGCLLSRAYKSCKNVYNWPQSRRFHISQKMLYFSTVHSLITCVYGIFSYIYIITIYWFPNFLFITPDASIFEQVIFTLFSYSAGARKTTASNTISQTCLYNFRVVRNSSMYKQRKRKDMWMSES